MQGDGVGGETAGGGASPADAPTPTGSAQASGAREVALDRLAALADRIAELRAS